MPFKPGKSGNSKGRPQNTGHRQKLFYSLVEPHRDTLVNKAIDMALSGNEMMLRIFLERILPIKPIDEPIQFDFPNIDITKADALIKVGKAVLLAVSNQDLTPTQGKILLETITIQRKNIEASELAQRVAEIESILKQRKQVKKHDKDK